MTLPKINYPIFELTLPSTQKPLKFRPFTVKEEKILLIAQESDELTDKLRALRQIVNNCCLNLDQDIGTLPAFDLEYVFLKIRSKSVGNIIELTYRDNDDQKTYDFTVDIDTVEVEFNPNHKKNIELTNSLGIIMKYPTIEILERAKVDTSDTNSVLTLVSQCIDTIYDEETTYNPKEYTVDELKDFVDSLSAKDFAKITAFFETMPNIKHTLKYKDSNGTEKTIVLQGIDDFFQ
jgi:hypothetical protein